MSSKTFIEIHKSTTSGVSAIIPLTQIANAVPSDDPAFYIATAAQGTVFIRRDALDQHVTKGPKRPQMPDAALVDTGYDDDEN